jgi:hypothetical protein
MLVYVTSRNVMQMRELSQRLAQLHGQEWLVPTSGCVVSIPVLMAVFPLAIMMLGPTANFALSSSSFVAWLIVESD